MVGNVPNQLRFINHYFNRIFLSKNKESWRGNFYGLKSSVDQFGPKYRAAFNALHERAVALVDDCQTLGEFNDLVDGMCVRRDKLLTLIDADARERRRAELRPEYFVTGYRRKVWETANRFLKLRGGTAASLDARLDHDPALEKFLLHEIQFLRRLGAIRPSPEREAISALRIANDIDALVTGKTDFAQLADLRRAAVILKSPRVFSGLTGGVMFVPQSLLDREKFLTFVIGRADLVRELLAAGVELEKIEVLPLTEKSNGKLSKTAESVSQDYQARLFANVGAAMPKLVSMYHDEFLDAFVRRQSARREFIAWYKRINPDAFDAAQPIDPAYLVERRPPPPPEPVKYAEYHESIDNSSSNSWDGERNRDWGGWEFGGPVHATPPPFD